MSDIKIAFYVFFSLNLARLIDGIFLSFHVLLYFIWIQNIQWQIVFKHRTVQPSTHCHQMSHLHDLSVIFYRWLLHWTENRCLFQLLSAILSAVAHTHSKQTFTQRPVLLWNDNLKKKHMRFRFANFQSEKMTGIFPNENIDMNLSEWFE